MSGRSNSTSSYQQIPTITGNLIQLSDSMTTGSNLTLPSPKSISSSVSSPSSSSANTVILTARLEV
uniref:Uncharacterized protein n=2 Tax=Tetranychus urticae TaxID=32264 RepID=T1KJ16_TETUR